MLFYLVGIFIYIMYVCEVCVCVKCGGGVGAHARGSQFLPSTLLETVSLLLPRPMLLACQLLLLVLPPCPILSELRQSYKSTECAHPPEV